MKSSSYWKDRANLRMNSYHKNSDKTIYKINNAYDKAIEDINKDIKKIFYKFQFDSGMSIAEAKDLLNTKIPKSELESIRSKINGIQDKNLKRYLMAQLNTKAYNSRMTRLEALKESIYINTKRIADVEFVQSELRYIKNINEAYYRNIYDIQKGTGIVTDFATMPVSAIEEILKNNWSGKHYSERIWSNSEVLAVKIEEVITSGLMSGKSSKNMAVELADLSQYGKMAAERLIRTETTYITNMAELESYKELDIDRYIFVATLDLRTSPMCREMDGKIIEVSKGIPGENLPPLHPWCRSTTRAYFEGMTRKRRARDPETGENYIIEDMDYKEWYQKCVVDRYGEQKAETFQKMIKNKASDRKQLNEFKEVLGKESPKTLKDFQDLKYNNSKEWELTKSFVISKKRKKISDNATLCQWKNISREANTKIVGIVTPNGIKITELSNHMIERFIGDGDKRIGVSVDSVRDALISPLDIKAIKVDDLDRKSQKFIGENATVSINPDTGNLIQTNPTSSKLAERLKRRKLDDKVK